MQLPASDMSCRVVSAKPVRPQLPLSVDTSSCRVVLYSASQLHHHHTYPASQPPALPALLFLWNGLGVTEHRNCCLFIYRQTCFASRMSCHYFLWQAGRAVSRRQKSHLLARKVSGGITRINIVINPSSWSFCELTAERPCSLPQTATFPAILPYFLGRTLGLQTHRKRKDARPCVRSPFAQRPF
jgi:hypothetical protein